MKLTRKDVKFLWTDSQPQAFDFLKESLVCAPVLKSFDPFLETQLKTDASAYGVRETLERKHLDTGGWHAVAYVSRILDKHQKNYRTSEKKLFAIVFAVKKFRHYLSGKPFKVITDHAALQYLLNLKEPQGRLNR